MDREILPQATVAQIFYHAHLNPIISNASPSPTKKSPELKMETNLFRRSLAPPTALCLIFLST